MHATRPTHSLNHLIDVTPNSTTLQKPPAIKTATIIQPYKRFQHKIRNHRHFEHSNGKIKAIADDYGQIVAKDPAVIAYKKHLVKRRLGKRLSKDTHTSTNMGIVHFLEYTDIPITDHAITDLIRHKQNFPLSHDIESAIDDFANPEPDAKATIRTRAKFASRILGIFTANYADLKTSVNTHFTPAKEDCTDGIFFEIYKHLDQETKNMIQWNMYVPQRAKAAYCVPLDNIDTSRTDYAVVFISDQDNQQTGANNKTDTAHICIVPLDFAKDIVAKAKAAHRNCPFPNHQSLWKKVTAIAKSEYHVTLHSNFCRKFFEDMATDKRIALEPAIAAFIMGDKTKLAATGHMPEFYNRKLRFTEKIVKAFKESQIERLLNLDNPTEPDLRNDNVELLSIIKQQAETITSLKATIETLANAPDRQAYRLTTLKH
ncbi:MAG: hypothetical protein ACYCPW_02210 [Nitrososphaerales archaeon]